MTSVWAQYLLLYKYIPIERYQRNNQKGKGKYWGVSKLIFSDVEVVIGGEPFVDKEMNIDTDDCNKEKM